MTLIPPILWEHVCDIQDETTGVECGVSICCMVIHDPNPAHDHRFMMLMLQLIHEMSAHPMYYEATHPFSPADIISGMEEFKREVCGDDEETYQLLLKVALGEHVLHIDCDGTVAKFR